MEAERLGAREQGGWDQGDGREGDRLNDMTYAKKQRNNGHSHFR